MFRRWAMGCQKWGQRPAQGLVQPATCEGHDIYSSTRIRELIRQGAFDRSAALMDHPFEFEAEVVRGDQRGRTIGYPTANQNVPLYVRPPYGIYAVRALIEGEDNLVANLANIAAVLNGYTITRPTYARCAALSW